MKTKHFDKRLSLKKKTVANLANHEMRAVYGGSFNTCHTDCQQNTCGCTAGSCQSYRTAC